MLRRGNPYGPEFQPTEPPYAQGPVGDDRDRGLLFLCYQSSLARGFMFVQQSWDNTSDFPQNATARTRSSVRRCSSGSSTSRRRLRI